MLKLPLALPWLVALDAAGFEDRLDVADEVDGAGRGCRQQGALLWG
jgi:hypothetical protein